MQTTSPTAALPTERFPYRGRVWRIYKRRAGEDAPWQLYFEQGGKRYPFSLGTTSKQHAIAEAKLKIDLHFAHREAELRASMVRPARRAASTVDELLIALPQLAIDAGPKCREQYRWGLLRLLQFTFDITEADARRLTLNCISAETGQKFFARVRSHAAHLASQSDQNKFKRAALAWFENTKALFSPVAVASMTADAGLVLPDSVDSFRSAAKLARFRAPAADTFPMPSDAILRRTFREWLKLARCPGYQIMGGDGNSRTRGELQAINPTARRNMFLAAGLMFACGLRKGEVQQIKWKHLTHDAHGQPRLVAGDVNVKNHSARIDVRPLDPVWTILLRVAAREGWQGGPDDYVLAQRPKTAGDHGGLVFSHGGHSDRTYWPFYHIGKWLRALGWHMQKSNHALRDCGASHVTMKFGLERAKIFCRHSTLSTTEAHYSNFVSEDKLDNPKKLRWLTWAGQKNPA